MRVSAPGHRLVGFRPSTRGTCELSSVVPPPFEVTSARVASSVCVTLRGELDIESAPRAHEALAKEATHGGTVVLDISQLAFIDSTGIRVLLVAWQESRAGTFTLRVTRGTPAVMRVFELLDLVDSLPFLGRAEQTQGGPA